jgi:hypothetical protein
MQRYKERAEEYMRAVERKRNEAASLAAEYKRAREEAEAAKAVSRSCPYITFIT